VRRGPGGGDLLVHQCRKCRRYERENNNKHFIYMEPESPEMMALLLKQIPALSGRNTQYVKRSGIQGLQILDSMFIWTEPNSMRQRLMLTIKADINDVSIQQRIKVEFIVRWRECPDCTKEARQRTWSAIVQLRQKRDDSRKGLLILELAIARNALMRKHILSVQTKKAGFDFSFPSLDKARQFTQYLSKVAPMRIKTTQSLVSEDKTNNTANIRHTLACEMVPLCRDDLVVVAKQAKGAGNLAGKLCLVLRVSSAVRLMNVTPSREVDVAAQCTDLHSDTYWRGESSYRLFLSSRRLVRFVVLDVELCDDERERYNSGDSEQVYEGPQSGVSKYVLADVEVARETDFGVNDETFTCVTHLGHLLAPGDVVLGYDLVSTVLSSEAEWSIENDVTSNFVMPDIVLVKKIKGGQDESRVEGGLETKHKKGKAKSSGSKKRDRRMKKEEQKQQKLEAAAARMGLNTDEDVYFDEDDFFDGEANAFSEAVQKENEKFEREIEMDEDLADDLAIVEKELAEQSFSDNEDDDCHQLTSSPT
jgi:nonsense-mediated mRNA decay protein 3